jgi:hypothetical protein
MSGRAIGILAAALFVLGAPAASQESDFEVKQQFEGRVQSLRTAVDQAASVTALDSLAVSIGELESGYRPRSAFLDKALYPETFASTIDGLKAMHAVAYERVSTIQMQGARILDLETRLAVMVGGIDSLRRERDRLFAELRASKQSNQQLQATIRQLTQSLQARDRLVFALLDSIFVPYQGAGRTTGDTQLENMGQKLQQTSAVARVADVASDNVRFLDVTALEPKSFASAMDQYDRFAKRWQAFRPDIVEASKARAAAITRATGGGGTGGTTTTPAVIPDPGTGVDSLLGLWKATLDGAIWRSVAGEFAAKSIYLPPFHDGATFTAAVRSYVDSAKASGKDASAFVNDVWKERVDKEWREVLSRPEVLGKEQYAALDASVSELAKKPFDATIILVLALIALAVGAVWYILSRRGRTQQA